MIESPTISTLPPQRTGLNFQKLREEGILLIEQSAGASWTDYNTHDPGITFLEALCYAITDLGYRMDMPIKDLLAAKEDNEAAMAGQFPTAAQALACEPVTETDYRKLFLDIPGVLNVWLFKNEGETYFANCKTSKVERKESDKKAVYKSFTINGLYDILIQIDPAAYPENATPNQITRVNKKLFDQVRQTYQEHRNLCEDLIKVDTIAYQQFSICADIQLVAGADIEQVHAQILFEVQRFLTPSVRRYTLQELLDLGKTADGIFQGPVPRFGFFDEDELEKSNLPPTGMTIRSSDLIGLIMKIPGVDAVLSLHLKHTDEAGDKGALWSLPIEKGMLPELSKTSPIRFYKDLFRYKSRPDELNAALTALEQADLEKRRNLENAVHDLPIPLGTWQDTGNFPSFQLDLPKLYGLSEIGLRPAGDKEADKIRLAKARQLKAYLLFFDQIMANHAALVEQLPNLMTHSPGHLRKTFFAQAVKGVRDLKLLIQNLENEDDSAFDQKINELLETLPLSNKQTNEKLHQTRSNRLLDHLLARYAENFNDYVLMMNHVFGGRRQEWEIIDDKAGFLKEYPLLSQHRARAFNATASLTDEEGNAQKLKLWYDEKDEGLDPALVNVAGVVRRVARLAGIDNYRTRSLGQIDYGIKSTEVNPGEFEFNFVVRKDGEVILRNAAKFATEQEAITAFRLAVRRGMFPDGYERKTSNDGRFFFNLTDKDGNNLARRSNLFSTENEREEAIQALIDCLTERFSEEGIFLIEHLLLRPDHRNDGFLPVCTEEGCQVCEALDPYSFRVSVVMPGYAPRFTNLAFRDYFEKTLRSELPAHVLAKICWIGKAQMIDFETKYKAWLEYRKDRLNTGKPDNDNSTLNDLIKILNDLHTIYPPGTLHDCEEDKDDRPIRLGFSHLGLQRELDLDPDDGGSVW